jgi:hypothetical protein
LGIVKLNRLVFLEILNDAGLTHCGTPHTQMVYVVTSFDFGGSSDVKIHAVTDSYETAQEVYSEVLAVCNLTNAARCSNATMMMAELTDVPMNTKLVGRDAKTLFWGSPHSDSAQLKVPSHVAPTHIPACESAHIPQHDASSVRKSPAPFSS